MSAQPIAEAGRAAAGSGRARFLLAGVLAAVLGPLVGSAVEISAADGEITGSLDSTLSVGVSVRVEDRDMDLIGRANGGNAHSINYDNGNLNYDQGDIFSAPIKLTQELDLSYRNFGLFLRGLVFYDFAIMDQDVDRKDPITGRQIRLSESAERLSGYDWRPLDAYVTGDFDVRGMGLTLRAGNQVVSWGESTFIQNGINTINPADLGALRVAGAEVREGLKPVPMVDATLNINDKFSLESFYQFVFRHTEIEPEGTFLSDNDFASPGGNAVFLGFGRPDVLDSPDLLLGAGRVNEALAPVGVVVPREDDHDAKDEGQFGVALRYFEPALNNTEFGFYWTHLHSRLPVLSARTGTPLGLASGDYASSAKYFREYPEGLDTLGVSFNTVLPGSGVALQGELSYAIDRPLQLDEVDLLFAAMTPLGAADPATGALFGQNNLGTFGFDEYIPGYKEKDVIQYQMTATQLFGPRLGADQLVLMGEAGVTYVVDMEDKEELLYNGPGTSTHRNELFTLAGVQPATQTDGFADETSCGYRVVARLEYNNAIGPVTLLPQVAFSHDVEGTTPGPGGNFVEDRKIVTASLSADYQRSLRATVSYSNFFGGGEYNQYGDRDFVSLSASYSF